MASTKLDKLGRPAKIEEVGSAAFCEQIREEIEEVEGIRFAGFVTTNNEKPEKTLKLGYERNDVIIDSDTGMTWVCAVSGSPGTWTPLHHAYGWKGYPNTEVEYWNDSTDDFVYGHERSELVSAHDRDWLIPDVRPEEHLLNGLGEPYQKEDPVVVEDTVDPNGVRVAGVQTPTYKKPEVVLPTKVTIESTVFTPGSKKIGDLPKSTCHLPTILDTINQYREQNELDPAIQDSLLFYTEPKPRQFLSFDETAESGMKLTFRSQEGLDSGRGGTKEEEPVG